MLTLVAKNEDVEKAVQIMKSHPYSSIYKTP